MGNTKLANPAPLGLMGFGMTTILLNLANSGLFRIRCSYPGDGHFLRRHCANFCRPAGIQKKATLLA